MMTVLNLTRWLAIPDSLRTAKKRMKWKLRLENELVRKDSTTILTDTRVRISCCSPTELFDPSPSLPKPQIARDYNPAAELNV